MSLKKKYSVKKYEEQPSFPTCVHVYSHEYVDLTEWKISWIFIHSGTMQVWFDIAQPPHPSSDSYVCYQSFDVIGIFCLLIYWQGQRPQLHLHIQWHFCEEKWKMK